MCAGTLAVAVAFAYERTAFVDLALHLYDAVTSGITIRNYRFVSAITQSVPVGLFAVRAPIEVVQLGYSLAFPTLYAAAWATAHFALRARGWALAWVLMWGAFATHTHYWIQSELPQGLALFVVALGLIGYRASGGGRRALAGALQVALLVTAAFAHPLLVVPATFAFGLSLLLDWSRRRTVAAAAAAYYAAYAVRARFFATPYDESAGHFADGFGTVTRGDFPPSVWRFVYDLGTDYYLFAAIVLLGPLLLWRSGAKLAAVWTLAAVGGHCGLVTLSYPTLATEVFYLENLLLPAGFMAGAGLAFGWERASGFGVSRPIALAVLAAFALRMVDVYWLGCTTFRERRERLEALVDRYRGEKVVIPATDALERELIMTWAVSYEAWLVSARRREPTTGVLVVEDPEAHHWRAGEAERLSLLWHRDRYDELPEAYFGDPGGAYRVVERAD